MGFASGFDVYPLRSMASLYFATGAKVAKLTDDVGEDELKDVAVRTEIPEVYPLGLTAELRDRASVLTDGVAQHTVWLNVVPEPRSVKNRVHLDLTSSAADRDQEIDRLLALGARRADIGQTGAESWTVLADPEGNEFCVVRPKETLIR